MAEYMTGVYLPRAVRATMAVVSLAVCITAALDFHGVAESQAEHDRDFEIINLAGRQSMLSQRVALLSANLTAGVGEAGALRASVTEMQREHERLADLLQVAPMAIGVSIPSMSPIASSAERILVAQATDDRQVSVLVAALQSESERFMAQWNDFMLALQRAGESATQDVERTHAIYMTLLAIFVSVVAMGSGEVFARRIVRKQARLRSQALELEKLALVAERTGNAVLLTDADGRMTWANEAYTRLTGYSLEESLGRSPGSMLQCAATDPATKLRLREAIAARQPIEVEILNRAKDGRLYWLHLDIQPLRKASGCIHGFVAVQTDITAQILERDRLSALLRALPAGVIEHRPDGKIADANLEAERILGLTRAQMLGVQALDSQWHTLTEAGEALPLSHHPASRALATGESQREAAMCITQPNGEKRWLRVNAEPLIGTDGEVVGAVSCFLDITQTIEQRRLLELTVDAAGLGTWEWHIESGVLRFSDRWHSMLGYSPGELTPRTSTWSSLVHPDDLTASMQSLEAYFDNRSLPYRSEFRVRSAEGRWVWVMAAGAVIEEGTEGRPRRLAGVHIDITARKTLEQALHDAALTDDLTRLPNRSALHARLERCRERDDADSCYAVLFMDFDRFKLINDSLGHEAGDALLRQIADRLCQALQAWDVHVAPDSTPSMAARLGGDEFVVLLERLNHPSDAERAAERLLVELAKPYHIAGEEVRSTASIGIVTSDRADRTPDALLRDADIAMYEAKQRGRGRCVVFSADMHERMRNALDLETDLRRALQADRGIYVLYQPIVDMTTSRIVGFEALARWEHPARGTVSPAEFIPLAEESGLILELGRRVLLTACQDMVKCRAALGAAAPATVSVNLSRAQIHPGVLTQQVAEILRETGLPPRVLRLEITESLAIQDETLVETLNELRSLGISLALDDFGTGYSSLASLDQLPLDAVKIDRSFICRMSESDYHTALIEATLRVSRSLRLDVVAEGVEAPEQAQRLLALGCRLGQGWLFGRPAPMPLTLEKAAELERVSE